MIADHISVLLPRNNSRYTQGDGGLCSYVELQFVELDTAKQLWAPAVGARSRVTAVRHARSECYSLNVTLFFEAARSILGRRSLAEPGLAKGTVGHH